MSAKKPTRRKPAAAAPLGDLLADEIMAPLAWLAPAAAPPAGVRARLLARIQAAQPEEHASGGPAWRIEELAKDDGWVPLPFPGVRMREVAIDDQRDTALLYVEMIPGAIFPDHEHTATERGVVLTGDLRMANRVLRAGEFYEAAAGTRHERVSSPSGCTGLLWLGAKAWSRWRVAMAAKRPRR